MKAFGNFHGPQSNLWNAFHVNCMQHRLASVCVSELCCMFGSLSWFPTMGPSCRKGWGARCRCWLAPLLFLCRGFVESPYPLDQANGCWEGEFEFGGS